MRSTTKINSALTYYLKSIFLIIKKVENWYWLWLTFFKVPLKVKLKKPKLQFYAASLMQVWTIKEVCLDQFYLRFVKLKKNWQIIDIGAGLGDFSIFSSYLVKKVFSYDQNPITDRLFIKNLKLNTVKNVFFHQQKANSLKQILKQNKLKTVDLLKLDCEGCEYELLNKADNKTLNCFKRLTMEYHCFDKKQKQAFKKMKEKLFKNNYQIKMINNPVHTNIGYLYANKN